jgi:hypothetical protein
MSKWLPIFSRHKSHTKITFQTAATIIDQGFCSLLLQQRDHEGQEKWPYYVDPLGAFTSKLAFHSKEISIEEEG